MAWEDRRGRQYYYRKKRIGKHVVSEYIGSGFLGEIVAEMEAEEREQRKYERSKFKKMKEETRVMDNELDSIGDLIRTLIRAKLILSGYHPHKGQWRKRRYD